MERYNRYKSLYFDKTDAEIIELLAWELTDKVEAIGILLNEINFLKGENIDCSDEICDCEDYKNGLVSNYCEVHNDIPLKQTDY